MTIEEDPAAGHSAGASHQPTGSQAAGPSRSDAGLLAALRVMWQRRDPPPSGLVDSILARIDALELDEEFELLALIESTERLAGVRGAAEARTMTFSSETATVMLRVSYLTGGHRRLDGWVSPPAILAVDVRCGGGLWQTTSNANGRFELADIPAGTATLRLRSQEPAASAELDMRDAVGAGQVGGTTQQVRLTTPPFEL